MSQSTITARGGNGYVNEYLTEQSHSGDTSYADVLDLVFTPEANSTYLIIASFALGGQASGYYYYGKLLNATTPADLFEGNVNPKDATDYLPWGAVAYESFGSSPSQQTYKIQFKASASNRTVYAKDARLIAIKLDSADEKAAAASRSTTTDTNWQDKLTLQFTPASQGDYLILACAIIDCSSASYDTKAQLDIDSSTQHHPIAIEFTDPGNAQPWFSVTKVTLDASQHDITAQYCTESASNTVGISQVWIVALRLDTFANNYYVAQDSRQYINDDAWNTAATITQTPNAGDHLIFACAITDCNSTVVSHKVQTTEDGSGMGETIEESHDVASVHAWFQAHYSDLSASSITWNLQYAGESSTPEVGIDDARILILELASAGGAGEYEAAATLTGDSDLDGLGAASALGDGAVSGDAALAALGLATALGSGGLSGDADLAGLGDATALGEGEVSSNADISGDGEALFGSAGIISGAAQLAGLGSAEAEGDGTLEGDGALSSLGTATAQAAATLTAEAQMVAAGIISILAEGTITAEAALAAAEQISAQAGGIVAAVASLVGLGEVTAEALATLTANAQIAGNYGIYEAEAELSAIASITASAVVAQLADGTLSASTTLAAARYSAVARDATLTTIAALIAEIAEALIPQIDFLILVKPEHTVELVPIQDTVEVVWPESTIEVVEPTKH